MPSLLCYQIITRLLDCLLKEEEEEEEEEGGGGGRNEVEVEAKDETIVLRVKHAVAALLHIAVVESDGSTLVPRCPVSIGPRTAHLSSPQPPAPRSHGVDEYCAGELHTILEGGPNSTELNKISSWGGTHFLNCYYQLLLLVLLLFGIESFVSFVPPPLLRFLPSSLPPAPPSLPLLRTTLDRAFFCSSELSPPFPPLRSPC